MDSIIAVVYVSCITSVVVATPSVRSVGTTLHTSHHSKKIYDVNKDDDSRYYPGRDANGESNNVEDLGSLCIVTCFIILTRSPSRINLYKGT